MMAGLARAVPFLTATLLANVSYATPLHSVRCELDGNASLRTQPQTWQGNLPSMETPDDDDDDGRRMVTARLAFSFSVFNTILKRLQLAADVLALAPKNSPPR